MAGKTIDLGAAEISRKLQQVTDYVRDCHARVAKGEIMDLQGLDTKVIEICDAIATLPEEEGREMEARMGQLIGSLEELARSMRGQQDGFSGKEEE